MRNCLIVICEGASPSIECTTEALKPYIPIDNPYYRYTVKTIDRTINRWRFPKVLAKTLSDSLPLADGVLLVGKSQGAYRLINWLQSENNRALIGVPYRVLTIDPHDWLGKLRPFKKPLSLPDDLQLKYAINIYQNREWPKGSPVEDSQNILIDTDKQAEPYCIETLDHYNIVLTKAVKNAFGGLLW